MNATSWWALAFSSSALAADCRDCHAAIAEAFSKTGMGRSVMERPSPSPGTCFHKLSNRHYTIRDGAMRRHQLSARGQEINTVEKRIDWAIGSGNHAITYASRNSAGQLIELPVSWYSQERVYAMSPGYDRPDHFDMRREVNESCLSCHSDSPQPAPIGCGRCHGDASRHLAKPGRGSILNPASLAPARQLDICLQCHLETASSGFTDSLRQPGRAAFSFRPGEPLANFKLYFDRTDPAESRLDINHAGYRLLRSACFTKSQGRMTCTTCHDPHAARVRDGSCAACHDSAHSRERTDCVGCHMPKRRTRDAIHVAMTDHWIRRSSTYEEPAREDHRSYAGPLVGFHTPVDDLSLRIANARQPSADMADLYRRRLRLAPDEGQTWAALGNVLFRLGRTKESQAALDRALRLDPSHAGAINTAAVLRGSAGATAEAIRLLEAGRTANPDHSLTWFNLGEAYRVAERKEEAAAAFREAIRLQPDFAEARVALAGLAPAGFSIEIK